ncbi:kinase-like domain-containing protein [Fimicolochytrium jonesii]|uniref:kinase-like domain-containing protein n=1 Tax=Fimicolochytrium jonesii TaxID=1396493 RepID=UPI0022FEA4C3|nr:kinase-like domain-containing protein [Fimicolochytrium jonesii]KAI8818308.1 kinase-like domain-containing protein [Fimicolochytrium jonesii]
MSNPRYTPTSDGLSPGTTPHSTRSQLTPALDTTTNTPVLLKQPLEQQTGEQEAVILKNLNARRIPNVVNLLDCYVDEGTKRPVLVFPVLKPLPPGNLNLITIAQFLRAMMETLAAIHELRIAHLNLSTASLMLDPEHIDSLTVISWGRATFHGPSPPPHPHTPPPTAHPQTATEAHLLAHPPPPSFTSPDIYAAGCILGQWLDPYLPNCSLTYLRSRLVRKSTTTYISRKLIDHLSAQRMQAEPPWIPIVADAADLLSRMLDPDEEIRIGAGEVLKHAFLTKGEEHFAGTDWRSWKSEMDRVAVRGRPAWKPSMAAEPIIRMRG